MSCRWACCWCLLLSFVSCCVAESVTVVVVGNPGAGKSTLVNSLCDKVVSPSGDSWATGMHNYCRTPERCRSDIGLHTGVEWYVYDTAGYNDLLMSRRTEALERITNVLRRCEGQRVVLLMVLCVRGGYVLPQESKLLKACLDAIETNEPKFNRYVVLVNKLTGSEKRIMTEAISDQWPSFFSSGLARTKKIQLVPQQEALLAKDNKTFPLAVMRSLAEVLNNVEPMRISRVKRVDVGSTSHSPLPAWLGPATGRLLRGVKIVAPLAILAAVLAGITALVISQGRKSCIWLRSELCRCLCPEKGVSSDPPPPETPTSEPFAGNSQ